MHPYISQALMAARMSDQHQRAANSRRARQARESARQARESARRPATAPQPASRPERVVPDCVVPDRMSPESVLPDCAVPDQARGETGSRLSRAGSR